MTQHYVQYWYPGLLFSEPSNEKINHRDPDKIKIPKGAYAFSFFDQEEMVKNGKTLRGEAENHSGYYFVNATIYTLAAVKKEFGKSASHSILITNMECNKYPYVVKTNIGTWQPFDNKKDKVIKVNGKNK